MTTAHPYYADKGLSAAFYDTVTAADVRLAGDLELYASLLPSGGSALELGSGTGRIALWLAAQGFHVVGVEIAPAMLAQAQAKRAELSPQIAGRVEFLRGDMTALDLQRRFEAVICGYFTLAHVPTGAAWRNTFATTARHLHSGGIAAFHLPLLDIMRLPGPADLDLAVLDEPAPTGGRLQLFVRERSFREEVSRLDQVIEYVELDARGKTLRSSRERQTYYCADPLPLAQAAGFALDRPPIPLGGVGEIWVFRKL